MRYSSGIEQLRGLKMLDSYFDFRNGLSSADGIYLLCDSLVVAILLFLDPFLARVTAPWYYVIAHCVH